MDVRDICPRHHTFLLLSEETTIGMVVTWPAASHSRIGCPCRTLHCEPTQTFLPSVVLVRHFVTAWKRAKDRMRRVSCVPEE